MRAAVARRMLIAPFAAARSRTQRSIEVQLELARGLGGRWSRRRHAARSLPLRFPLRLEDPFDENFLLSVMTFWMTSTASAPAPIKRTGLRMRSRSLGGCGSPPAARIKEDILRCESIFSSCGEKAASRRPFRGTSMTTLEFESSGNMGTRACPSFLALNAANQSPPSLDAVKEVFVWSF